MGLTSRTATRVTWLLLSVMTSAACIDAALLWRDEQRNAQIAAGMVPADAADLPPPMQFAQAHAQAASGADEAALKRYAALHGNSPLGRAARYNSANLLMRQAAVLREGPQAGQALPLIELAKESYREVLRQDAEHWDARYNLERAQRLVPDPEEAADEALQGSRSAERAATTMRGYSPGMP